MQEGGIIFNMNLITIVVFFVMMWGLGHLITRLVTIKDPLERTFIRLGIGLGIFSVLGILFNLMRIPLSWYTFFALSAISPLISLNPYLTKKEKIPKFEFSKEHIFLAIIIFASIIHLGVFLYGAFSYPYLEDGDPWDHSRSIRYIASQKTAFEPSVSEEVFKFMDAYPPTFDILMAVLYQVSDNLIWTLKLFNSLLISLTFIMFYLFCKKISNDPKKALLASLILILIPSYMSHFIWALTISMALFFPCLYSLESIKEDPKWRYIAAIMIGALLVSQPSMAVVMSIMIFLYWGIKSLVHRNWNKHIVIAGILGILISGLWWGAIYVRVGSPLTNEWTGVYSPNMVESQKRIGEFSPGFRIIGTADRVYTFGDFFFARFPNMINNPIGIGQALFLLFGLSILYSLATIKTLFRPENEWKLLCIVLLIFTLLGINGARLPVQFLAFRFWMLFAIPLSFLVGGVLAEIVGFKTYLRVMLVALVLVGVAVTSGVTKYKINTAVWYPSYMASPEEMVGYFNFSQQFPKHQRIFSACRDTVYKLAAYDQDECIWCKQDISMRERFINETPENIHSFLKKENYKYILFDLSCFSVYNDWEMRVVIENLGVSNLFEQVKSFDAILILKPK